MITPTSEGKPFVPTGTVDGVIPKVEEPQPPQPAATIISKLQWGGEIPSQKWMNFYQRVLSRFATGGGKLKINISIEFSEDSGISSQKIEETKVSLQELGLSDDVELK